jgi:hypothetical protein
MSDCYCDYEPAQFYRGKVAKAKIPHKCDECCRTIAPGESYERVFYKWDGITGTSRTCSHCLDIRQFVKNSVPCFCWYHGSMRDDAMEAVRDAYWRASDEVRGLFVGFGRLVIKADRAKRQVTA